MNPTCDSANCETTDEERINEKSKYIKRIETRNKDWDKCDLEEKTEKLKMAVKDFESIKWQLQNLQQEVSQLNMHSHADGRLVVPMNNAPKGLVGCSTLSPNKNILD